MKKNLLQLINKENQIRDCAVTNSDSSGFDIEFEIYNVPQFIEWKEAIRYELQAVSPDGYIVRVLELIDSFDGWNDRNNFNNLVAMLNVVKNNVAVGICGLYYCNNIRRRSILGGGTANAEIYTYVTMKNIMDCYCAG